MNTDVLSIIKTIEVINQIHDDKYINKTGDVATTVFTQGMCYYYAKMLQYLYPNSCLCIDDNMNHITCKIGCYLYDANGILPDESKFHAVDEYDLNMIDLLMLPKNRNERSQLKSICSNILSDLNNETKGKKPKCRI